MDEIQNSMLKDFLVLSYAELEELNMGLKEDRRKGKGQEYFRNKLHAYLTEEKRLKAVTVCFTDIEGKFLMLDYNKKFLLAGEDNLTFDGSSIKGFATQDKSDLRLRIDWSSFRWLPADIFGPGKVIVFASVHDQDGNAYESDFRERLRGLTGELITKRKMTVHVSPEIEGILLEGVDAEQHFNEEEGFELATSGGYFNALPQDRLRQFIDRVAEAQRAMAYENEKDHPEVAPAQFELNYAHTDVVQAADQAQLYKLICRQVAKTMGLTATFLPKPKMNINGSAMHTNMSIEKAGKNMFYSAKGEFGLSGDAHKFLNGILFHAKDLCLVLNSSVNSYRRLDPHFEAPNEIRVSPRDRSAMIRVPLGNERSARIEVRSVGSDINPYLTFYSLLAAGLEGMDAPAAKQKQYAAVLKKREKLPSNIYDALRYFKRSSFMEEAMGRDPFRKLAEVKETAANRCPKDLGTKVKRGEVLYHHDITNQYLWNKY